MSHRSISSLIVSASFFVLVGTGVASAQGVCTYTVRAALRDCTVGPGDRLCVPCVSEPCDFVCRLQQAMHLVAPPPPGRCQANVRCIRRDCTLFLQTEIVGGTCSVRCPTGAHPLPGPFTCVADSGVLPPPTATQPPAPTATEAAEVTPTETPEATETVEATETPEATETETPEVIEPTETPEPVEPTETPEVIEPTETPEPVEPTETPEVIEPTETPEAVEPTETPQPAETAEPTETPEG